MSDVNEKAKQAIEEAVAGGVSAAAFSRMVERFLWAATTGPGHPDATGEKAVLEILKPLLPLNAPVAPAPDRDVPDDGKLHGPEIDEALEWAERHTPPHLGLCVTALHTRSEQVTDMQVKEGTNPENVEDAKKILLAAGDAFGDDAARAMVARITLGGTFTIGIATGIRLASMMSPDRLAEIVASAGEQD